MKRTAGRRLGGIAAGALVLIASQAHGQTAAERVAATLALGVRAEQIHDGPALLTQARALRRLGARPDSGDDLAKAWLVEARVWGAERPGDEVWRGRTLGPAYRAGHVDAHTEFSTQQSFNAGQTADIAVVPADGQPLGLTVRDDSGHDVCALAPSLRNLGCTWIPSFTGTNDIIVRNDNATPARFYFISN